MKWRREIQVTGGKTYTVDSDEAGFFQVQTGGDKFFFSPDRKWLKTETDRKGFVPVAWEARMVLDAALGEPEKKPVVVKAKRGSMQAVTISLPPEAVTWLADRAQNRGISRSQLVAELIAVAMGAKPGA